MHELISQYLHVESKISLTSIPGALTLSSNYQWDARDTHTYIQAKHKHTLNKINKINPKILFIKKKEKNMPSLLAWQS